VNPLCLAFHDRLLHVTVQTAVNESSLGAAREPALIEVKRCESRRHASVRLVRMRCAQTGRVMRIRVVISPTKAVVFLLLRPRRDRSMV
jgi:hypothetical protein